AIGTCPSVRSEESALPRRGRSRRYRRELFFQLPHVGLELTGSDQFVLAAGEELIQVVKKGTGLCRSRVELELKLLHASSQENRHVDLVQQPTIEVTLAQRVVAKGVERSDERGLLKARHFFSDAAFHFPRRLLREGQGENVFGLHAFRVLQQVDNAM